MDIPFYCRFHAQSESTYLESCLSSNLETDGFFMERLLSLTKTLYPGRRLLFTPSCTLALETALACLHLKPGDEVLLPSFNFPSAANVILRYGAVPVLCDITPDTQNLSVQDAARRITARTKAVVAVHYAGIACPIDELSALAKEASIALVEDAAQCSGAFYKGQPLGSLGDFGCVSYHHTKNITCGEGGLMITGDEAAWQYARQYRLHGTDRAGYMAGEVSRYTWNLPGSCAALSEPQAALLLAQMEALDEITARRLRVMEQYRELLTPLGERGIARLMAVPSYARANGHIFYLRFASAAQCETVRTKMAEAGIDCKTHYVPLHASPMGARLGYREQDLPESLACYQTLLRLPIHTELTSADIERTAQAILDLCLHENPIDEENNHAL